MTYQSASNRDTSLHTLSVLVENRPGVLARISGLFARRAFNINSLSVSPTERPDISRITVTAAVDEVPLDQIVKQLNKLLHVLKIVDLDPNTTVERELVLIKVAANQTNRSDVLEIVRLFRVRVVDVNPDSLTIEATGASGKIDALLSLLEHYGIIELVRSGSVAVTRGPKALSEKVMGSEITGR
ncbi:acetolactate synthase small subunit [Bifidobacterium dolichotidis]|uniref:Acetolactate synthase small subunit n=1 Tax=Bifidobacterium dolichotidis TaxID=2306976 RepID=A0A430FQL1_9BIFI|nr:acetolactate synthase small subunit [Bifidobacterium dolichotidis]RSX55094.1 acetolactate synthase small subunit [Bifidobacterium dolichotidis]